MGKRTMVISNHVHCALLSISFLQNYDNGKERNKDINVNFCFTVNLVLVLGPWFPLTSFLWWSSRATAEDLISSGGRGPFILVGVWLEVEVAKFVTKVGGKDLAPLCTGHAGIFATRPPAIVDYRGGDGTCFHASSSQIVQRSRQI